MAPTSPGVTQTLSLICIPEVAGEGHTGSFVGPVVANTKWEKHFDV